MEGRGEGVVCFVLRRTRPFEDSVSTILLPIVVALSNNTLSINCFHVYCVFQLVIFFIKDFSLTIRTRY